MSQSPYDNASSPLPADFVCPACGYDLSGAAVERCSECGLEIDQAVREAHETQREYLAKNGWRRDLLIGLSPIVIAIAAALAETPFLSMPSVVVLVYALIYAGVMLVALFPGVVSSAIYASRFPKGMRLAWFGALAGMQLVAQLPIMCGLLIGSLLSRAVAVLGEVGPLPAFLPALGMLAGLLFVGRLWKLMWRRHVRRAGLVLNRQIDRQVHGIFLISLTPSMLVFLVGIAQFALILFFST